VLGTEGLARYIDKQGALARESLTADPFIMALQAKLGPNTFTGTSTELLALVGEPERPPRGWPGNARSITQRLNRQAPVMRKCGWYIDSDHGANENHAVRWTLSPHPEIAGIPCSSDSSNSSAGVIAGQAANSTSVPTSQDESTRAKTSQDVAREPTLWPGQTSQTSQTSQGSGSSQDEDVKVRGYSVLEKVPEQDSGTGTQLAGTGTGKVAGTSDKPLTRAVPDVPLVPDYAGKETEPSDEFVEDGPSVAEWGELEDQVSGCSDAFDADNDYQGWEGDGHDPEF
jgi:hypothetical protein